MVSSPAQPASAAATTPTTAATAAAVMVEMLVRIVMMLLTLLLNTLKVEKLQCLFHSLAIYFSQQLRKRRKATTETEYPPSCWASAGVVPIASDVAPLLPPE